MLDATQSTGPFITRTLGHAYQERPVRMQKQFPNSQRKLSELTITARVTFAPWARLFVLMREEP